jgi:hypothetical protein
MRRAQGIYYLAGGLWPFVHWRSFTAVAGPKPDRFQTEVTAALFAATGAALLVDENSLSRDVLSVATAIACIGVDRRFDEDIRWVFKVDTALNIFFLVNAFRRLTQDVKERALPTEVG